MSGSRIIEAVEEAARGDFSRITTHGQVWVRDGVDKAAAWDAIVAARRAEREICALVADQVAVNAERRAAGHAPQSQAQEAAYNKMEGAQEVARQIRERAPRLPQENADAK